jgi:hypothetical protein
LTLKHSLTMKNKLIILLFTAVILSSCAAPGYLPFPNEVGVNQYGSFIHIHRITGTDIKGELIALDSNQLIVLVPCNSSAKSVIVPMNEIRHFTLRYARSKHYGWTIPVYTLATISHGFFLLFTAPVNFIVTVSVTTKGNKAYMYNDKNLTYEQLKMFARFPEGIPSTIDLASIK